MAPDISVREALSGISGSISLVAWIFVLVPQLLENYKNGNAEGLSLAFLLTWLVGDVTNLIGAVWGNLLGTVIALGVYFCFADAFLIAQTVYYNHLTKAPEGKSTTPSQPLLVERRPSTASGRSVRRRRSVVHRDSFSQYLLKKRSSKEAAARNTGAVLAVCAAGALGWYIAWKTGAWTAVPDTPDAGMPLGAKVLGYISAALYLGARIPQIIQNHQQKSVEGLSILFFMLSLVGNISYSAGILFHSTEKDYVWSNLPWLIGSAGTVTEDLYIFGQFYYFTKKTHRKRFHSVVVDEEEV